MPIDSVIVPPEETDGLRPLGLALHLLPVCWQLKHQTLSGENLEDNGSNPTQTKFKTPQKKIVTCSTHDKPENLIIEISALWVY